MAGTRIGDLLDASPLLNDDFIMIEQVEGTRKTTVSNFIKPINDNLINKVDKISGKGLSSNDYNDTDKAEVAKIKDKANSSDVTTLTTIVEGKADLDKIKDYTFSPQSPIPPKQSYIKNTNCIVLKRDANELLVIQKTNKGYLRYSMNNKTGSASNSGNYGEFNELVRLTDARPLESVYVYKDLVPVTGTLDVYQAARLNANDIETSLLNLANKEDTRNISNKSGYFGSAIYRITKDTEFTFTMNYTYSTKANLAFMVSPTSVQKVKISVNGILVKEFNPRMYLNNGQTGYSIVDFDIPSSTVTGTFQVTIRAEDTSGYFYPCCFNFYELKDYKNQDIDNWKAFGSNKGGYVTSGANDYALADSNNRWFGSYHGGEKLENIQLTWCTTPYPKLETNIYQEVLENIDNGIWRILENFQIYQKTDLIQKAKMHSIFDFSTDGTIEMKFSFKVYGDLLLNAFCTALTCTDTKFSYLFMPHLEDLGGVASGNEIKIPLSEGYIRQVNPTDKMQLDIRFTKFHEYNNAKGAYLLDHSYYRKFYYNVVTNVKNCEIPTLQFSKALDFSIR